MIGLMVILPIQMSIFRKTLYNSEQVSGQQTILQTTDLFYGMRIIGIFGQIFEL